MAIRVTADSVTKKIVPALVAANQGTGSGDFAAGDDSRITGAAQKSANLSDLTSPTTARTNLGLGTIATETAADYRRLVTVDDLPASGIVLAHRGGGDTLATPIAGDNMVSAWDLSLALGSHIIDVDARRTREGTWVAMHDATIDRTTAGTGNVADLASWQLPKCQASKHAGSAWADEPVPTIAEVLIRYGGRAVIQIEPKVLTNADIDSLCDLIKAHKLERSVIVSQSGLVVCQRVVSNGCLACQWGVSTVQHITDADAAGLWMVETSSHNPGSDVVAAAQAATNIQRIIAPVHTRTQEAAMTAGLDGVSTDAPGYVGRLSGASPSVAGIAATLAANKRGAGWKLTNYPSYLFDVSGGAHGLVPNRVIYLGDMSGTMPGTYSIAFTFVCGALMAGDANTSVRVRIASPEAETAGSDATAGGYVCSLRGSGRMQMWVGAAGGAFTQIGDRTDAALISGTTYTVRVDVTPTTVNMYRVDTATEFGAIANATFRGDNIYVYSSGSGSSVVASLVGVERT